MYGKKHSSKTHDSRRTHESQTNGQLSDWKWSNTYRRYYREGSDGQRYYAEQYDEQGNAEGVWDSGAQPANENPYTTPRSKAQVEQLTTDFGALNVNPAGYSHNRVASYSNQVGFLTQTNDTYPDQNALSGYTIDRRLHDDEDGSHSQSQSHSRLHPQSRYDYTTRSNHRLEPNPDPGTTGGSFPFYDRANPYYQQSSGDDELKQVLKINRDQFLGNIRNGEPSNSVVRYETGSTYAGSYEPSAISPQDGERFPSSDFGFPMQPNHSDPRIWTPEHVEFTDSRYVVEHSNRFQPGEVFKILWCEPMGQVQGQAQAPSQSRRQTEVPVSNRKPVTNAAGQFYVGYRRFIIVGTDESHHSTCVPISTYNRLGCTKRGIRPDKHGIIYSLGQEPKLLSGEPELGFRPVPMKMYAEGETLSTQSRVNYSKLVTIEHNAKVFFIGRIPDIYFGKVSAAVDQCWSEKKHKARNKPRK